MRIRALKPGFFANEDLCELSPWHRLAFEGLWCCADRQGRIEDRPKRLKGFIFPYDDLDMNTLLWDLSHAGFIIRYAVNGHPLIWIPTWDDHQHPRQDEPQSRLAAFEPGTERRNGPDQTTFPASRPLDTVDSIGVTGTVTGPSLHSDEGVTAQRIGQLDNWTIGPLDKAPPPAATPVVRAQDLIDLWNATTKPPVPRCRELTEERRRKIRARVNKQPSMAWWREVFEAVQSNPFYRGENDRQWTADFDWITKNDTNPVKVHERAQSRKDSRSSGWVCPHEPHCDGRWKCHQKTELDAMKAGV